MNPHEKDALDRLRDEYRALEADWEEGLISTEDFVDERRFLDREREKLECPHLWDDTPEPEWGGRWS